MICLMRSPAASFSRTMSLLGDAEVPVHEDIERGSRAVMELIIIGGAMLAVLLGIAFYVMRNRNRELERTLAGRQRAEQEILELNKETGRMSILILVCGFPVTRLWPLLHSRVVFYFGKIAFGIMT